MKCTIQQIIACADAMLNAEISSFSRPNLASSAEAMPCPAQGKKRKHPRFLPPSTLHQYTEGIAQYPLQCLGKRSHKEDNTRNPPLPLAHTQPPPKRLCMKLSGNRHSTFDPWCRDHPDVQEKVVRGKAMLYKRGKTLMSLDTLAIISDLVKAERRIPEQRKELQNPDLSRFDRAYAHTVLALEKYIYRYARAKLVDRAEEAIEMQCTKKYAEVVVERWFPSGVAEDLEGDFPAEREVAKCVGTRSGRSSKVKGTI